jgi:LPS export ABC transporter permease LptG
MRGDALTNTACYPELPMPRTLDRYIVREVIPPFVLSLLILTFLLVLPPVMQYLENLLAKGVTWTTAARIIWTAVPQALGLTIPMSLLVGLLVGLGRLSADRETVALLACGVSPYRLLVPVGILSAVGAAATAYVMLVALPDANQTFRELTFEVISKRVESDIRPRIFFEDFPGWVLYARDEPEPGTPGWKDILVSDTTNPRTTNIYLAHRARLVLNRAKREVHLVLSDGTRYSTSKPGEAETFRFPGESWLKLNPQEVFREAGLPRGVAEKTIPELRRDLAEKVRNGISPHPEIIAIQQKFSIPAACLVFGIVGLALGMTVARDTKMAGFVVGIAVIFVYYVVFLLAESVTKGYYATPDAVRAGGHFLAAHLARWAPNIVMGGFGIVALIWRARYTEARLPARSAMLIGRLLTRASGVLRRRDAAAPPESRSPAAQRTPKTVIVIRVPHLYVPLPGLLDRYIARLYLRVAGLSFLALLGLFYISTFIDRSDKIFKGQASPGMVGQLLVYMTPQFVYFVIPIATLLSVLVTFGLLSRSSELTVMKACGISLYRAAGAVVLLSLVASTALFSLEQQLLAPANRRADALDRQIRGRPPRLQDVRNRQWVVGRDGDTFYHYAYFDPMRDELAGLVIYKANVASWNLTTTTYADRATYGDGWTAVSGWEEDFASDRAKAAGKPLWQPLTNYALGGLESPDFFKSEQPLADMMTVGQLKQYVDELSATGANVIPLMVDLQKKMAFPLVTFVMTLLAVPFGVSTGKRGTLYGIGLGIVIALSYWILISAFVAVGKGGLLSPVLAGWAPNILVASAAGYLFLTVRT